MHRTRLNVQDGGDKRRLYAFETTNGGGTTTQNLRRAEILDFVASDFDEYAR